MYVCLYKYLGIQLIHASVLYLKYTYPFISIYTL